MRILKKATTVLLVLVMCLFVCVGCFPTTPNDKPDDDPKVDPNEPVAPTVPMVNYGERIPEPEHYLFENFKFGAGGFTESAFYINNNRWGYNNNGVKGESVGYTADGVAVLKAYGDYTDKLGYKRSGSCLLSRDYIGPGLIEVSMKILPRLGGCTAIWPFYAGTNEATGKYQYQEIDIEYPAGAENGGAIAATYEKVMNTNYAKTWSEEGGGPYRSTKTETFTPANDGAWHKYSIMWETSPKLRVRYFVDGVLTSDTNDMVGGERTLSDATSQLKLGFWFPDGWAGDRDFDESQVLIDWVSYQPYNNQPRSESKKPSSPSGVYHQSLYPTKPIVINEENFISNGDFSSTSSTDQTGAEKYAWGSNFLPSMLVNTASSGKALKLNAGQSVSQVITGVYGKTRSGDTTFGNNSYYYSYDFSGAFTASGTCAGTIKIEFLDANGNPIASGAEVITLTQSGNFAKSVQSVNGSKSMRITLTVTSGSGIFDNLKMLFKGLVTA